MKTLIILLIISGIIFLYFVVNAEKSILVKGSEVMPIGTDIPRFILSKARGLVSVFIGNGIKNSSDDNLINNFQPKISNIVQTVAEKFKNKVEDLISGAASKIANSIKEPIKNKINETLCPIK